MWDCKKDGHITNWLPNVVVVRCSTCGMMLTQDATGKLRECYVNIQSLSAFPIIADYDIVGLRVC